MSSQRRENFQEVALGATSGSVRGVLGFVRGVGGVLFVIGGVRSVVRGVVGVGGGVLVVFVLDVSARAKGRRGSQAPAGLGPVPPLAARSLRWVRGLLPGDEGAAWLAEVTSLLTETTDEDERRRYVRSYRRNVPQLIWTSWTTHLSASRQRELL